MTLSTSAAQSTPSIFSTKAIANAFRALDESAMFSTSAKFKEGVIDLHSGISDIMGVRKFQVGIRTPSNTQAHFELVVPKGVNQSDAQITVGPESDFKSLVILNAALEDDDFTKTVIVQNQRNGIIHHNDWKMLKDPAASLAAKKTHKRINSHMTAYFRPAFELISQVNNVKPLNVKMTQITLVTDELDNPKPNIQYTPDVTQTTLVTDLTKFKRDNSKPHVQCMQANVKDVCVVDTFEMFDRLTVTLMSPDGDYITFESRLSWNDQDEEVGYYFPEVTAYRGTEKQFTDMIGEVVDLAETEELANMLKNIDLRETGCRLIS